MSRLHAKFGILVVHAEARRVGRGQQIDERAKILRSPARAA